MSNMNKKVFFFAVAMLTLAFSAKAQHFEVGGIAYNVLSATERTVEVVPLASCDYYHGNITIPPTVTHDGITYDVTVLGKEAFYRASLSNITIPSSVTQIKYGCFLFSSGLSSITIPASVRDIADLAFAATNLSAINVDTANPHFRSIGGMLFTKDTSTIVECPIRKSGDIVLPQNTRHIAPKAFTYCQSITGVTLPNGLLSIGDGAFAYANSLNNMVIPATVSIIGHNLFGSCTALTSLTLAEGNSHYYQDGMAIYSAAGDTLVSCHMSADTVILPATLRVLDGFNFNRDVKCVVVPDGVTEVCDNAFANSSLVSIDLPSRMTMIDEYAFYSCKSLAHVGMPESLDSLGEGVLEECSNLTSIVIPNGLRVVPQDAFYFCEKLSQIAWGDAVAVIDSFAFGGCALTELRLPSTLRSVRLGAFSGYYKGRLKSVVFTAPVDTVEPEVFATHRLNTLRFENTVPPVSATMTAMPEYPADYGCLFTVQVDSILIPCGSLDAWLADSYWGRFADKYHEVCNGVDDVAAERVSVFPNPAACMLTVSGVEGSGSITLMDIQGKVVLNRETAGGTTEIDVSRLARGLYFLRIQLADGIAARRIILQ